MDVAGLSKLVHALIGVLFVAGLVGRWITLGQAARAQKVSDIRAMLTVSARFERIVILSSILVMVMVMGIVTAIAQGRPFLGPLQGAPVDWLFVSLILSVSVLPLVPLVFLPRGRVFEAALEEATAQDAVTERLSRAFRDPVVFAAHAYELAVTFVVLVLMFAKPF